MTADRRTLRSYRPWSFRRPGKCDDCGPGRIVRTVRFHSGMLYTVCQDHEHEYRYMRAIADASWRDKATAEAWSRGAFRS